MHINAVLVFASDKETPYGICQEHNLHLDNRHDGLSHCHVALSDTMVLYMPQWGELCYGDMSIGAGVDDLYAIDALQARIAPLMIQAHQGSISAPELADMLLTSADQAAELFVGRKGGKPHRFHPTMLNPKPTQDDLSDDPHRAPTSTS